MPKDPLKVNFFKTSGGAEPVRDWLKDFSQADKKIIGADIRTVQIGWPLGMPLVRKMAKDLWEIRITVSDGIARIFLTIDSSGNILLLHGFVKKSQETPKHELDLAKERLKQSRSSKNG